MLGQIMDMNGKPIDIDGLWALAPGNNGNAGSKDLLYFTAGPDEETHGLFGVLVARHCNHNCRFPAKTTGARKPLLISTCSTLISARNVAAVGAITRSCLPSRITLPAAAPA